MVAILGPMYAMIIHANLAVAHLLIVNHVVGNLINFKKNKYYFIYSVLEK